mmetsp:Transcript_4825/g.10244  ORF Transcript_4825/g.10244 Transcript_4825/m.10244 type:complete len:564 (+) Transcript_4825:198-1889(+)
MCLPNTILLPLFFCILSASGFQRPPSIRCGIVATSKRIQPTTAKLPFSSHQLHVAETLTSTRKHAATGAEEQETTTLDTGIFTWTTPPMVQKEASEARRDRLATKRRAVTEQEDEARDKQDQFFILLTVVPSLLAFMSWEDISHTLAVFLDKYGAIGRAVDGGQFAVNLLRPTITGVVVPVISIALATLVSTTVNVLRARQVELRALVNKESCELRLLRRAVFGMFGTRQHANRRAKALALLCGYVEQLERESNVGAVEALEELELSGGICVNELDRLAQMLHGVDGAAASRQGSVGVADGLILSLNGHRSDRVALLLSVFPVIHWGVLVALSLSVCVTFLLVSNQQILQYLNSVQLRALFAILVGVFSGTATLCLDLADPFRGSFSIAEASTQLGDLRLCLKEDVAEACAEAGEISSSLVHALLLGGSRESSIDSDLVSNRYSPATEPSGQLNSKLHDKGGELAEEGGISASSLKRGSDSGSSNDWGSSPRRYGLVSTLYFHLLTGPLGSNVRVLGDVIAWVATFVASRTRSLSQRVVALSAAVGRKSWRLRRRNASSSSKT